MGRVPYLCLITTTTTTTSPQGTYVHQPGSQGIVTTQGTHQGKNQTRSLPRGAPTPGKERGETFLGTACPGLYMLTCVCFRPIQ